MYCETISVAELCLPSPVFNPFSNIYLLLKRCFEGTQNFAQFNSIEILNESKVIIIFQIRNIYFIICFRKIIQSALGSIVSAAEN